jgi:DNA-directed RNA polymerase specialized sigma24 family protein
MAASEPIDTSGERQLQQVQLLALARSAAQRGEAFEMLRLLVESRVLDGLKRQLTRRRYSMVRPIPGGDVIDPDCDLAVAEATDSLYAALSTGQSIANIASYLVKVAERRLIDQVRVRIREGTRDRLDEQSDHRSGSILDDLAKRDETPIDHDQLRREAFIVVRGLLPRLGHVRAQQVMTMILEAAEEGAIDLPDPTISEALGITVESAKKSRQRAFQRLARIAREEGLGSAILDRVQPQFPEIE